MRAVAAAAALVAVAVAAGLAGWALRGGGDVPATGVAVQLTPLEAGGAVGVAALGAGGGWVAAWGLEPASAHRVEAGALDGRCPRAQVALGTARADAAGVAFLRVGAAASAAARPGWGVAVRTTATARSARTACGAARGGVALSDAQLSAAGPGPALPADASTLVQLRDGRPTAGVRSLRVRRGSWVALALRSDRRDVLALDGLGLRAQVGPGTVQRLAVRATRPGRFGLRGRSTGGRAVLVVDVR